MRAALYARFSSDKQDAELSIGGQVQGLKEYADKHGYEYSEKHIYIDEAKSALSDNRPAFKQMIANAKSQPKPFDVILVWKLSRFARSRQDSIVYKSLLEKEGIDVVSINEKFDDSPAGQLLEGIIEAIDEFYSTNLAQDTLRGMTENAKKGFFNGGTAPTGYQRKKLKDGSVERTTLEPDPTFAPVIQRMFSMAAHGDSFKTIVATLNKEGITTRAGKKWGTSSVRQILANEVYTGTFVWNKSTEEESVRVENAYPAIVDRDTFNNVQKMLQEKRRSRKSPQTEGSSYLLSGLLTCGLCGWSLTGASGRGRGRKYMYYTCGQKLKKGKDECDFEAVPKDRLESVVLEYVQNGLLDEEVLQDFIERSNQKARDKHGAIESDLQSLDIKIQSQKKRLNKLYEALETGEMEVQDLAPRIRELRQSLENLEETKRQHREFLSDLEFEIMDFGSVSSYIQRLQKLLKTAQTARRKSILKAFVRNITVYPEELEINFRVPVNCDGLAEDGSFRLCSEVAPRRAPKSLHGQR